MADEMAKLKESLDQHQAMMDEVAKLKEEMARLGQHFLTKEIALKEELMLNVRPTENSTSKDKSTQLF